jgi:hypothetical protein
MPLRAFLQRRQSAACRWSPALAFANRLVSSALPYPFLLTPGSELHPKCMPDTNFSGCIVADLRRSAAAVKEMRLLEKVLTL